MCVDTTARRCATAAATRAVEAQRANHWFSTAATATVAAVTAVAVVGVEVTTAAPAEEKPTASAAGLQLRNSAVACGTVGVQAVLDSSGQASPSGLTSRLSRAPAWASPQPGSRFSPHCSADCSV